MSSGGGGTPTSQTITQSNIPDWLQPQVETLLGGATQELFQTKPNTTTDASGNQVTTQDINKVKPYNPYSQNPSDYVAGFSPLQQNSQYQSGQLQVPGQIGTGSDITAASAATSADVGQRGLGYGQNAADVGANYAANATNPNSIAQYMNPYLQSSLAPQLAIQQQQQGAAQQTQNAQAAQAGAFGGSRAGVQAAATGLNNQLANQNLIGQGYANAYNQANQNQQFGANLNLQGNQTALQGVNTALQGLNQAGQMGTQLGNLGGQELAAQTGILGLQNQMGAQQQAQQQNIINQGISNYANAQQYPMQQLNAYNALLRGYAIPGQTATSYQAAPSAVSQLAGLGTAGIGALGLYNASNGH
jgi:hypothetical protein